MTDEFNELNGFTSESEKTIEAHIEEIVNRRVAEILAAQAPAESIDNYVVPEGKVLVLRTSKYIRPDDLGNTNKVHFVIDDGTTSLPEKMDPDTWPVVSFHSRYDNVLRRAVDFVWPKEFGATVTLDEDFDPRPVCGKGLHGLLWGYGDESYLNFEEMNLCWQILEVDEDVIVHVEGDKVKFPGGRMILSTPDRHLAVQFLHRHAPVLPENQEAYDKAVGKMPRRVFSQDFQRNKRYENDTNCIETNLGPMSNLVSSRIKGSDLHAPVLDLDFPARTWESSTPGHTHLAMDVAIPWRKYKKFLKAAAKAGIIEEGYYRASVDRGGSYLRLPWVKKWKTEQNASTFD